MTGIHMLDAKFEVWNIQLELIETIETSETYA